MSALHALDWMEGCNPRAAADNADVHANVHADAARKNAWRQDSLSSGKLKTDDDEDGDVDGDGDGAMRGVIRHWGVGDAASRLSYNRLC